MTSSYTFSASTTFTITHARHITAKVATDLKRVQRFYGKPTNAQIADYEQELTELLKGGYVDWVAYGFQRIVDSADSLLHSARPRWRQH